MNDNSLNNLNTLWKKLDNGDKLNKEENQNKDQNSFANIVLRYKLNSKWLPPLFGKLPIPDYDSKSSSKEFSMAYNNEEKRCQSFPNVNKFY